MAEVRLCAGCGAEIPSERLGHAKYCYTCSPRRAQERPHPSGRDSPANLPDPELPPVDLVRVVLLLDRAALEDLDLMVTYRLGPRSRSELVREAIAWWRAKNAAWIIRARDVDARRAARESEEARAIAVARAERDRQAAAVTLAEARSIVALGNPTGGVG